MAIWVPLGLGARMLAPRSTRLVGALPFVVQATSGELVTLRGYAGTRASVGSEIWTSILPMLAPVKRPLRASMLDSMPS